SFRAADAILGPTLHGTMYCTLAAGRRWIARKHKGVVLSILSTSTITGRAFTVPSAMAKSAVLAMTRSLAVEWGPKGIRTVAIAPGAF
ncbi:SDR family oxidoreductase, partial [Acinetobacter baumannii]